MSTPVLTSAWQRWLRDNWARGCREADMVQSMVEAGWPREQAQQAVRAQGLAAPSDAPPQATTTRAEPAPPATAHAHTEQPTPRWNARGNWLQVLDRRVRVSLHLATPVVALVDDFLSPQECEALMAQSRRKLKRSAIVDPATGRDAVIEARSSEGTHFALAEDAFIARIDARIAALMNWPQENGEGIQILRYGVGGEYRAHWDYFAPDDPGSAVHLAHGGQRVSTLVMYLNDVAEGGGTHFPDLGLTITPKQGAALYFEYCDAQGRLEPRSLHAGLPVLAGEKWIATKWMRQQRYV
ncbi:MAG: 2OG-Fe(II) oxygenase [Rhodoferax sp.]